jgi:hypothetical protein
MPVGIVSLQADIVPRQADTDVVSVNIVPLQTDRDPMSIDRGPV